MICTNYFVGSVTGSSVVSSSALADNLLSSQKECRVSFMGPTGDQQEENAAVVSAIPDKKKGKSVADSSALDPPIVACFPPKMWPVSTRKRRKKIRHQLQSAKSRRSRVCMRHQVSHCEWQDNFELTMRTYWKAPRVLFTLGETSTLSCKHPVSIQGT